MNKQKVEMETKRKFSPWVWCREGECWRHLVVCGLRRCECVEMLEVVGEIRGVLGKEGAKDDQSVVQKVSKDGEGGL